MNKITLVEALLFASGSPLSLIKLADASRASEDDLADILKTIEEKYNTDSSGIHLLINGGEAQFVSHPAAAPVIEELFSKELSQEITRPQLEVLSVIAYRFPVTQAEIERIRGGNCTLILRNLELRDLISSVYDKTRFDTVYTPTNHAMHVLGIERVEDLPRFAEFHEHEALTDFLRVSETDEEII